MRIDTLHLTMAFLGQTPDSQIPFLADIGLACARTAAPFDLALDHLGYWARKHLVWAGPRVVPEALSQLAEALAGRLGDALDDRRFNPHVTLVRRAGGVAELPAPTLSWRVDALCLVRSVSAPSGVRYDTIGRWALGE